jgi:beta-galactosidase
VRINESQDDDEFYKKTNAIAHQFDTSRQTGGVRYLKKSHMLEDVYTYNDFSYDGFGAGIEKKHKVISKKNVPYLVSEYNGHMYPTKAFDDEKHRLEHALRHAKVLDEILGEDEVSGGFAWCMFDYNTHKDFGSGDKICYHGLMDMFRNPKLAAAVYRSQSNDGTILEVGTSMDIGEHPGGRQGKIYAFTNADSVRVYKNNEFIREFWPTSKEFPHLEHPPIIVEDMIGDRLMEVEGFSKRKAEQVKGLLRAFAEHGFRLPIKSKLMAAKLMVMNKLTFQDAYRLYSTYYSDWGSQARKYRFDAIKNGEVAVSVVKCPTDRPHLELDVSHMMLVEDTTYDVASIRIHAKGQQGNLLTYYQEPLELRSEGAIEIIGPRIISMKGGCTGTYVRSKKVSGEGKLTIISNDMETIELSFVVYVN